MTKLVTHQIQTLANGAPVFCIALAAPRSNALEPAMLTDFHAALDALDRSGARHALITGGRNFSTGGDVARFHDAAARGEGLTYARKTVPLLQDALRRMIAMPVIFAAAARGATTGGSAGFLFASDLVTLAPDAFVQPYYTTVGFAPDGGWTALLPDRIGAGAAEAWLMQDARRDAAALVASGLATAVDPAPEDRALALLSSRDIDAALATKALIWDAERQAAIAARLAAETDSFCDLIGRDETIAKMARFLGKMATENV